MINLKKKKKWPWEGFETYFLTGLMSMMLLALAAMMIMFIFMGFEKAPIITGTILGFFVLVIPVGYFVVHVLGIKADDL